MVYKEVRKRLRLMYYTEKPYSIFKISLFSKRIRIILSTVLGMFSCMLLLNGEYFRAVEVITYGISLVFLGYIRSFLITLIPVTIEICSDKLMLTDSVEVTVIFVFAVLFVWKVINYMINNGYYINILNFTRGQKYIEFDNAISSFIPINNFIKCIIISIFNMEKENISDRHSLVSRLISQCIIKGRKKGFICAGCMTDIESSDINIYIYTSPENETNTLEYFNYIFEQLSGLEITSNVFEDTKWNVYADQLRPDQFEKQELYNNYYIDYLENRNIDFEKEYKLFYRFKVRSYNEISLFAEELRRRGYSIVTESLINNYWEDGTHMFVVSKQSRIGKYRIDMITREFVELAGKYNSELSDWILGGENATRIN